MTWGVRQNLKRFHQETLSYGFIPIIPVNFRRKEKAFRINFREIVFLQDHCCFFVDLCDVCFGCSSRFCGGEGKILSF